MVHVCITNTFDYVTKKKKYLWLSKLRRKKIPLMNLLGLMSIPIILDAPLALDPSATWPKLQLAFSLPINWIINENSSWLRQLEQLIITWKY